MAEQLGISDISEFDRQDNYYYMLCQIFVFVATSSAVACCQILEAVEAPRCSRLAQPDHCPDDWNAFMLRCWSAMPESRPTFSDVVESLPGVSHALASFSETSPH